MHINPNPAPFAARVGLSPEYHAGSDYKEVLDSKSVAERLACSFKRASTQTSDLGGRITEYISAFERCKDPAEDEKELGTGRFEVDLKRVSKKVDYTSDHDGVGTAWTQGIRPEMEDAHLTEVITVQGKRVLITGIFDGHDNDEASKFAAENFTSHFKKRFVEFLGRGVDEDVAVWNALKLSFVDTHRSFPKKIGGTTANVAIQMNDSVWIANLGDARALVVDGDDVTQLSEDAKPEIDIFKKSIEKRRAKVFELRPGMGQRVQGKIGPARFIGNHNFGQISSPRPKITKYEGGDILIQGCDGVFDVTTSQMIGDYAKELKAEGFTPARIAAEIVRIALKTGSTDNISATVTFL